MTADSNRSYIARHFPELHLRIENESFVPGAYHGVIMQGKKDKWTLSIATPTGNRFLHSQYDPQSEALRWAERQVPPKGGVVLLLGWGLGYHALEWLRCHGSQVEAVVIWEPEADFFVESLAFASLQPLLKAPRVEIVIGADEAWLYKALHKYLSFMLSRDLTVVPMPFADIYSPEAIHLLRSQMQAIASRKQHALQYMAQMGQTLQEHIIGNLRHIPECYLPRDLHNRASQQPAVIVAAGPSLDKNIERLKEAQGKAWIFAVDTSLRILQKHGIEAQLVVSKDPTDLNREHFRELHDIHSPMLAFDPQIHPETVEKFVGPKIWMPSRTRQIHALLSGFELTPVDELPYSTNVALTAFNLAVAMGCDPIIFVGLDLCFSQGDGFSHASHSALCSQTQFDRESRQLQYERDGITDTVEGLLVQGIDGNYYPTIPNFLEALRLLETLIQKANKRCVDASEGGASIAGTQIMTLQDALQQYCRTPIDTEDFARRERPKRDRNALALCISGIARHVKECREWAKATLQEIESKESIDDDLIAMMEARRLRLEEDQRIYRELEAALERLLVEIDRSDFWDSTSNNSMELYQRYLRYFQEMARTCAFYTPLYEEAATVMR